MEKKATRIGFSEELAILGGENEKIFVIDADLGKSCKSDKFGHAYPDREINVGIAEQNAAGVAAGLAAVGKIPFVVTYAIFASLRMGEMVRQEIAYPRLNVKIAGSHGGMSPARDGASHQSIEDMGVMRTIPNMTVIMPADYWSARKLTRAVAEYEGPVFIRFTRDSIPIIYDENTEFEIGKAHLVRDGKDIAIIANGDTVHVALEAAEKLAEEGISAKVLDMHTIKPLDVDAVKDCAENIGKIITVEDHNIINGLGSAVCEVVAELGKGKVKRFGIPDKFGESASYERLLEKNGVSINEIVQAAKELSIDFVEVF
ncbi:MAG: transketolase family protein [Selenomonadaceae bacterium]|nr:transketolase family protein [Selenomonadaceae bacterium]